MNFWQSPVLWSAAGRLQHGYNTAAEWMMSGDIATSLQGSRQHTAREFTSFAENHL